MPPTTNLISEDKTIYVLHQLEADFHYEGLKYFCQSNGYEFKFRQFSWISLMLSGVKHLNRNKRLTRGISDFFFLFKLLFVKRKTIVLGIAPYDYRLVFFNLISKKHNLFYHTSWPYWDASNFPENRYHSLFKKSILNSWRSFLEENCKGIFCVSQFTQDQLKLNYAIKCPTAVVYHSIDKDTFYPSTDVEANKPVKFFFAGRLVTSKGIAELLKVSEDLANTDFKLGVAGGGPLAINIETDTSIKFYGKVKRPQLAELFRQHDFLLCPSKKWEGWEELFGIAIIEAMACGCVPVATGHVGPKEIIKPGIDGFLIQEENLYNNLLEQINTLENLDSETIIDIKKNAIKKGQQFYTVHIADRWALIMNKYILT